MFMSAALTRYTAAAVGQSDMKGMANMKTVLIPCVRTIARTRPNLRASHGLKTDTSPIVMPESASKGPV
jgi:hypothetical protein